MSQESYQDLLEYVARKHIETAYWNLKAGRPVPARKILKQCQTKHLKSLQYTLLICTHLPVGIFNKLMFTEDFVRKVYSKCGSVKV